MEKEKVIVYKNLAIERWYEVVKHFTEVARANGFTRIALLKKLTKDIEDGKIKL